ncbi:restriction endonuclease subunit S [Pleionea mediterranea]|uniref:Type I restriction enzyme S subunit n=1 Tax=Pleionea mediterranea TaxID=523701 RepID=A0A316FES9_9GAMM|nr:restriction endonuclease subunit S [Pleionea mediterranea]PWK46853.1 type I restriction enzyme S subunit [Pleionea mediterranea]
MSVESVITSNLDIWTSAIKTKSASGRGSSNKLELYGIKKLRELILELAVRGKLVPQDPDDSSVEQLVSRVEQDRAEFFKKTGIRPPKVNNTKDTYTEPYTIPDNWLWISNSKVFSLVKGKRPKDLSESMQKFEYLDIEALDRGNINRFTNDDKVPRATSEDILVVCDGSRSGLVLDGRNGVIGSTLARVDVPTYLREFIKLFFKQSFNRLNTSMKGAAIPHLDTKELRAGFFALPPLEEQGRILNKVDELMSLCDQLESQTEASIQAHKTLVETLLATLTNAKDADEINDSWQRISEHFDVLFTTEDSIDQLKQTILQLAVMGKLVKQDPNDEPASKLLQRIAAEKEQLIKEKKIKKQKPLPQISDDEKPFELPVGWEWCRIGAVTLSRLGKMLDKAKNKGRELPYLRNTNVQWGSFQLDDIKLMKFEEDELDEFRLQVGDLLICEGGEPGRCAIWLDSSTDMYFQKALHRVRPLGKVLSEYLEICLTVDSANGGLEKYFTGATIKHLVGAKLNIYVLPLPPIGEQGRIVRKAKELFESCDALKAKVQTAQSMQNQLADTISDSAA